MIDKRDLRGAAVEGGQGELVGQIESTYLDDATGEPIWAAVSDGEHTELVSLNAASYDSGVLRLGSGAADLDRHRTDPRPRARADKHLFGRARNWPRPPSCP